VRQIFKICGYRILGTLALIWSLACIGCGRKSAPGGSTTIPFQVIDHEGSAALQFLGWTVVFEAIPSRTVSVGQTNLLYNGPRPPSVSSDLSFGGLQLRQFWSPQTWIISVNNLPIRILENGQRITFGDHRSYALKDKARTIIVSGNGNTREAPQ
jgi:hypothetical protein